MKIFIPILLLVYITGCARVEQPKVETVEGVVADILTESEKIKPGMTRADLSHYFTKEGGIQTKLEKYDSKRCDIIKVDVKFNPPASSGQFQGSPTDTILSISKPYLGWTSYD
jgi:hypothetical protein